MTRPDMRMEGGIVGVRSTEQSVGIKVGGVMTLASYIFNNYFIDIYF